MIFWPYPGGELHISARHPSGRPASMLAGIEGQLIQSINDLSEVREIFAGSDMAAVELKYGALKSIVIEARELIIQGGAA